MVYDPKSLQAQKGKLGEKVVREILEEWGAKVTRPDGSAPDEENHSLVDFYAVPSEKNPLFKTRYVKVKVRKALPYAYGQYPCYSFPVVQIETYRNFAREQKVQLDLWIVDPEANLILSGYLDDADKDNSLYNLHEKRFIDGKEFPFDQETKFGNMRFFHQKQFGSGLGIYEPYLGELRKLYEIELNEKFAFDAVALWNELDYGTGLGADWFSDEALLALKTLRDEFGAEKVSDAIANFCDEHYDEFCDTVGEYGCSCCSLDDVIKNLRAELTEATNPQSQQNQLAKPVDILTAPNGTNIDILTVDGNKHFFVKVARVSTAVGYKNPSISPQSALIVAAKRLGVTCYRFETQRLSGGDSYGTKGYYFAVSDVPKVLIQYCELHYNAKSGTRQAQFNEAAKELCDWFRRNVTMQYGS